MERHFQMNLFKSVMFCPGGAVSDGSLGLGCRAFESYRRRLLSDLTPFYGPNFQKSRVTVVK